MKIFKDPKIKEKTLEEFIDLTDSFSAEIDYDSYYYLTESFCVAIFMKVVFVNFGEDIEDRLDYILIAPRDGKTEYEAIERKLNELKKKVADNPKVNKYKTALRKYKKNICDIPMFEPYQKAEAEDCFYQSLVNVNYEPILENSNNYVVLDVETNGLRKKDDDLLSISIYDPSKKICYNRFLPLDLQPIVKTTDINGISETDLKEQKHLTQSEVDKIIEYFDLNNKTILTFSGNGTFDMGFFKNYLNRHGIIGLDNVVEDNIKKYVPTGLYGFQNSASKDNLCKLFNIEGVQDIHSSLNDCVLEWKLFEKFVGLKPFRINNTFYKFNKDYVIPVTVLTKNTKLFKYAGIELHILGTTECIYQYRVSDKALNSIKQFSNNVTGISFEHILYASLETINCDNTNFLIQNKMKLEPIATVKQNVEEVMVDVDDDGLLVALDEKHEEYIKQVNNVALSIKQEMSEVINFIKENIFQKEKIYKSELVISEDKKVLAICDLSSDSAVLEVKAYRPPLSLLGYIDFSFAHQLYYQAKGRNIYYLSFSISEEYNEHSGKKEAAECLFEIHKVNILILTKEEYLERIHKPTRFEKDIIAFLEQNPNATLELLSKEFKCSKRSASCYLNALLSKGLIEVSGPKSKRVWSIKK